jgi:hypothetical protein
MNKTLRKYFHIYFDILNKQETALISNNHDVNFLWNENKEEYYTIDLVIKQKVGAKRNALLMIKMNVNGIKS